MTEQLRASRLLWATAIRIEDFGSDAPNDEIADVVRRAHNDVRVEPRVDKHRDHSIRRHNLFQDYPCHAMTQLAKMVNGVVRRHMSDIYNIREGFSVAAQAEVGVTLPQSHLPIHDHAKRDFAAVYYAHWSGGEGGRLRLFDDRHWARKFRPTPGMSFHDSQYFEVTPVTGRMVLFPGYVLHDVSTWFGEGDRVVVSMIVDVVDDKAHRMVTIG